jgi:hypothetical protein
LTEEEVIRCRHRLKKAGKLRVAELLTDEIQRASCPYPAPETIQLFARVPRKGTTLT